MTNSSEARRQYYLEHREQERQYQKDYYRKNREIVLAKIKKRYFSVIDVAERRKKYSKKYYTEHKGQAKRYSKNYYRQHAEYCKEYQKELKPKKYRSQWKKENRLLINLRGRIYKALKGMTKVDSTKQLIGCSIRNLKNYLKKQFEIGMTWENYGSWHVDHIKQCNRFDLSKKEEQRKCFHYINLRPLWAKDNLIRSR